MLGPQARLSRIGPLYYLFGAPHSAACASAPGRHCLLAGPVSTPRELPASAGERLTIAHRGSLVSTAGAPAQNQHFAIALDGRLLTVPFIDFRTNPDGVAAGGGADLLGGFTRRSAGELSSLLRSGPLPVDLVSIR